MISYRPIAELAEADFTQAGGRDVVVFNDCNGPDLDRLWPGDIADYREGGVWTHFILLPNNPDDIVSCCATHTRELADKDRRIQELLEANNAYLERARSAEAEAKRLLAAFSNYAVSSPLDIGTTTWISLLRRCG